MKRKWSWVTVAIAGLAVSGVVRGQDLIWEDQGLTNAVGIASGSTFQYNGAQVALTWSVTNSGSDTIVPAYGSNYVSYQAGMEGGHVGHALIGFDVSDDDYRNYVTLKFSFSTAQTNLAFSLLDIDYGTWDDGVEVTYNGTNNIIGSDPSIWSYAQTNASLRTVVTDNKWYIIGFEGTVGGAATNQNYGNLDLDFSGIAISDVTIRYFCTGDGRDDPGSQKIGISDLLVTEVPEPAVVFALAMGCVGILASRRRASRPGKRAG